MATAHVNGIDLCYETSGDASGPPVLLIAGLDMQLIAWPEEYCERLGAAGHFVIRYDNRDIGLSTHLGEFGQPDLQGLLEGRNSEMPYSLGDMADDAVGLLDHLGLEAAHVVGISMGGMIAQTVAINHPGRVLSLCSIMSNTGDHAVGQPTAEAVAALLQPPPKDRKEAIDFAIRIWQVIGSPAYPFDVELERQRVADAYDRSHDPEGVARQAAAILTAGDRTEALHAVRVPTLVIHGDSDTLVDVSGGEATARAIPGARLLILEGMGHDLPPELADRLLTAILEHVAVVEKATPWVRTAP
jgi:pimeloyl-ACP methyl ester carboxylesterase